MIHNDQYVINPVPRDTDSDRRSIDAAHRYPTEPTTRLRGAHALARVHAGQGSRTMLAMPSSARPHTAASAELRLLASSGTQEHGLVARSGSPRTVAIRPRTEAATSPSAPRRPRLHNERHLSQRAPRDRGFQAIGQKKTNKTKIATTYTPRCSRRALARHVRVRRLRSSPPSGFSRWGVWVACGWCGGNLEKPPKRASSMRYCLGGGPWGLCKV
jgi:hypothetical protein|eukprot:7044288-Prymnesium_polylepis.1